ncbi:AcrR family transcriptional regulator [Streptomyces sp. CG 926]|uniref:TetR/AcrR family transcriptional regulator n=1 Tax=Streptomyces sp. CG 926 TaxID=1882405 RepID=UPI000D7AF03C|nr:TetR family transcriptional regulator [Streptomyces sp. CG 926]PWK69544.1 AcrR family transcriptional regulator [Streptomyces sp. CG 926]
MPASPTPGPAPDRAVRPRDADARRAEILAAARRAFARHAYADTTIGAIADDAGVSPALVMKYYGSKEHLFNQVFTFDADATALFDAPLDGLARHMVLHLLATQRGQTRDPILRIAFSRHHLELGGQARANFRTQVIDALAARLPGPDAALRAELAVGVLLGLGALYATVQADRLTSLAPDEVADLYIPLLQPLLSGEAPTGR